MKELAQILWIGGSPCAGKSTLAITLAQRYGLTHYSCDDALLSHLRRSNPSTHPMLHKLSNSSWNELWTRPVERQIREELAFYREELPLILEDLRAFSPDTAVIAEGTALLPDLVAPLLHDRRRGVWLLPSVSFQREHYARRPWVGDILRQCADPERAFDHWMRRDSGFADTVEASAKARDLSVLRVDGTQSVEEMTAIATDVLCLSAS